MYTMRMNSLRNSLTMVLVTVFLTLAFQSPSQAEECQFENSTGSFYWYFVSGSTAKPAARKSTLIAEDQQFLTDQTPYHPLMTKPTLESFLPATFESWHTKDDLAPKPLAQKEKISFKKVKITAYYTPEKGQPKYFNGTYEKEKRINGGNLTSYDTKPEIGHVATDPKIFPRGTQFELFNPIFGKKTCLRAEDTGGKINGYHLDIYAGRGITGYNNVLKIIRTCKKMDVKVIQVRT